MGLNNEFASGRPWIVFDIETCPMPSCGEYMNDPIEAPSNYKDPIKIAEYVTNRRLKQIADAALDLDLCEVVAIGVSDGSGAPLALTRQTHDERKLLEWFWRMGREKTLVGFNCLTFDLPILLRRSLYLNVQTPHVNLDRYRHDGVIDVADMLTYSGKVRMRSLAFYCKRFGIPFDNSVSGEQIPLFVADQKWTEIASHVEADVAGTQALASRIGAIYAPVAEAVL